MKAVSRQKRILIPVFRTASMPVKTSDWTGECIRLRSVVDSRNTTGTPFPTREVFQWRVNLRDPFNIDGSRKVNRHCHCNKGEKRRI